MFFKIVNDVYDDATMKELLRVYPTKKPDATKGDDFISRGSRYDVLLAPSFTVQPKTTLHEYKKLPIKPWVRALMTFGKAGAQVWHIDDKASTRVRYLTLIVALDDMTDEMPHVEFNIDGVIKMPMLRKNQGVLFDGRLLHRGGAGNVTRVPVVYQVYTNNVDENVEDGAMEYRPQKKRKFVEPK